MKKKSFVIIVLWLFLGTAFAALPISSVGPETVRIRVGQKLVGKQRDLVHSARKLLEEATVSYVYGGAKLGTATDCATCNECLEGEHPAANRRLLVCPECSRCSLDCSHFTQIVFERAGMSHPYLTSKDMVALSPERLARDFGFLTLVGGANVAQPGDLLVYKGHVAMVERLRNNGMADVIHATGGRDIREPGQGIQRERWADLGHFRGPLLRILRHKSLTSTVQDH